MAVDYHLSSSLLENEMPVLRFYGWKPYCLSIGYHQKSELIDHTQLRQHGYDSVRRPTGGRAIFHAEELTYSVHIPKNLLHHQHLYLFIHEVFTSALCDLGYKVDLKSSKNALPKITNKPDDIPCFTKSAWSEIQFEGKKVVGSAQKINPESILQHGSILIGNIHLCISQYLNIKDDTRKILKKEMQEKTICLNEINPQPITPDLLITSILNQLELLSHISVNSRDLSISEYQSAKKYLDLFC